MGYYTCTRYTALWSLIMLSNLHCSIVASITVLFGVAPLMCRHCLAKSQVKLVNACQKQRKLNRRKMQCNKQADCRLLSSLGLLHVA